MRPSHQSGPRLWLDNPRQRTQHKHRRICKGRAPRARPQTHAISQAVNASRHPSGHGQPTVSRHAQSDDWCILRRTSKVLAMPEQPIIVQQVKGARERSGVKDRLVWHGSGSALERVKRALAHPASLHHPAHARVTLVPIASILEADPSGERLERRTRKKNLLAERPRDARRVVAHRRHARVASLRQRDGHRDKRDEPHHRDSKNTNCAAPQDYRECVG
jgi:hypothetical protein